MMIPMMAAYLKVECSINDIFLKVLIDIDLVIIIN